MTALIVRKSLACLLSNNSLPPSKFRVLFYLSLSTESGKQRGEGPTTLCEFLIHRHHFSPESASRVASVLTQRKNLEIVDSILSFLKESGFSNAQLEKTANAFPNVLSAKLETTIKPKFRIFQDFGFYASEIADIVSKNASLMQFSADKLISLLTSLKGLLGSNVEVAKFLRASGGFYRDAEKNLLPNVEFLKSCGVPMEQIIKVMNPPRFFSCKPEMMRKYVQKAEDLGLNRSSRNFIYAVRTVSSMTNRTWELKLKTFRELGFQEDDILRVFRMTPAVFTVSEKKMKDVTKVLLQTRRYDMSCIVNNPTVLQYSIEKRYRPRLQVLSILENKNLIQEWPYLGTMHKLPDAKFFTKFVAPHIDEVGQVWSAVIKSSCKST